MNNDSKFKDPIRLSSEFYKDASDIINHGISVIPSKDYLLVLEEYEDSTTRSGLLLSTESEDTGQNRGIVINSLNEDDIGMFVIYNKFSPYQIDYRGRKFVMLRREDVIGYMAVPEDQALGNGMIRKADSTAY